MPRGLSPTAPFTATFLAAALLLGGALLPSVAGAQPWQEDLKEQEAPPHLGKTVAFKAGDETIQAYLATPQEKGPYPGVVVIHDWWGLNDQVRGVADRLAAIGYAAIVPDLYHGKIPKDAGLARELMRALNDDWAVEVIRDAGQYLRSDANVKAPAVGTIGFSMGGRLSLAAALKKVPLQAAVMYYGSVETNPASLAPLETPLLGLFGMDDPGVRKEDVRRFEMALNAGGKDATILIYAGAGHSFFNEQRPSYVREAAADAWERTRLFLEEHLRAKRAGRKRAVVPKTPIPDR